MKIHVLMENTTVDPALTAEHGLSLFVETRRHKVLFDAGQTGAFADNARRMDVDLRDVDVVVLSHGHYDHGGGLRYFLELNDRAPVYLSRHAFTPHFNGSEKYIGLDRTLEGCERLVSVGDALRIDEELTLYSCNQSKRIAPLESFGLTVRTRGALTPDDFRHEQYLLVRDGERKILFSGCSHKGILNIANWFRPDILVGGFHFTKLNPDDPEDGKCLERVARELSRFPTKYYTGHCTGIRQYQFLKQIMGDQLEYFSTGQTFSL